ncbi:MAG: putative transporter [Candidatus Delongbacteria bacterium]|nr:putative transporter [Candidatus Delongbacteria bacterium]MBN2833972.1 putative transporter [Candidatus Delongbacteria bacterium]
MDSILSLFSGSGTASTVIFISLTGVIGVMLGKLHVKKVKLGIAGVLFAGLAIAHFGAELDAHVSHFIREFGLILFVYSIGIEVGPRFFNSLKNEGLKLNGFAALIVFLGFLTAFVIYKITGIDPAAITGIMSGAVTNTPGLGAAQQVMSDLKISNGVELAGMGYAVAYPFGIIGIILTMMIVRTFFNIKIENEVQSYTESLGSNQNKLESVKISITNPNLFGKKISYIKTMVDKELVISRIFRNDEFIVATENEVLQEGDKLIGVSNTSLIENLTVKIGKVEISEKREITGDMAMAHILITNRKIAGKTIQQIGIYRRYEANITRIYRSGIEILATLNTIVEMGDTVRVVGKKDLLNDIKNELGNSVRELAIPNTLPIFLGIFLGVILGSLPIFIPGLPAPAKLGMAGGPLLIAILLGHKGRVGSFDFYMTPGANHMLREIGIILFLACVGLSSGGKFVETIANGGYMWMVYGALITFIPIIIVGVIARMRKVNYLKICGVLAGSMTDPPALEFANSIAQVQAQSTAYATVYPLTMFLRVLLAQVLVLIIS